MSEASAPVRRPLFQEAGTAALPSRPALLGGACADCGEVFFPMQTYGCERCGKQRLSERLLTGRGRVLTLAKVHEHHGPGREAPFTVAAIELEDGPMVRALLDPASADDIVIGDTVVTVIVPETRPGRGAHDIRFGKNG